MPLAVSLKALGPSAAPIHALWREAGAFEDVPSMAALGYAPHLTLAVYEAIAPERLVAVVAEAFAGMAAPAVAFAGVRRFDGPATVLWAAPEAPEALGDFHAAVHRVIDPALCHPHYRPGAWVPHASLATAVPAAARARALAWAARPRAPFTVVFDVVDAVRFPPVAVLAERRLG